MPPRVKLARVNANGPGTRPGPPMRPVQSALEINPCPAFDNDSSGRNGLQTKEKIGFILKELGVSNRAAAICLGVETYRLSAWRGLASGKHLSLFMLPRFTVAFGPALLEWICEQCGHACVDPKTAEAGRLALEIARDGEEILKLGRIA